MFDIGLGEIAIIAVVGLLVFGPDRLPRAAADAARMVRNLRAMATTARRDLVDAAGLDSDEAKQTLRDLGQFHPKRLVGDLFNEDDASSGGGNSAGAPTPKPGQPRKPQTFDPDAT
jgi:sec-independent protein translocase protein TatB